MKKESNEALKEKLLTLKDIGPEIPDSILLYVFDKPVFVVDEYIKKLSKNIKLPINFLILFCRKFLKKICLKILNCISFHALIVIEGKKISKLVLNKN